MASSPSSDKDESCSSPWNTLEDTVVEVSSFDSECDTSDGSFKTPCQSFSEETTFGKITDDATEIITDNLMSEGNTEESEGHEEETNQANLKEEGHDAFKIIRDEFQEEPTFIREEIEQEVEAKSMIVRDDLHDESNEYLGVHSEGSEVDSKETFNISCEPVQEDPTITSETSFTSPHQLSPCFEDQDTFGVLVNVQTPASVFSVQCGPPRRRPSSCCGKSTRWCINHNFVSTPTQISAIPFKLPLTPVNSKQEVQDGSPSIFLDTFGSPRNGDILRCEASCIMSLEEILREDEEALDDKTANMAMIESHVSIPNTLEMLQKITSGMPTVNDRNQKDFPVELSDGLSAYQKYGLGWLLWREQHFPEGGILVGDVGFDKPAIFKGLIMKSRQDHQPTLIICPNIEVLEKWGKNFKKKRSCLKYYLYHGSRRTLNADKLKQYDVVLTTFHIITAENPKKASTVLHPSPLMKVYWHRIIVDNAEEISKLDLVRTQAILKLEGRHRWAVLWESPPRKNVDPRDLRSIVKFLQLKPFDDEEIWEYLFEGMNESKDEVAEIILNSLIPPARH